MLNLLRAHVHAKNLFIFASEQKFYNSLNKDLVSKYFLVVFTLSFIHSFGVEHDYLVSSFFSSTTSMLCYNEICSRFSCACIEIWMHLGSLKSTQATLTLLSCS